MTMDLYGHLIDQNLRDAAKRIDAVSQSEGTTLARPGPAAGSASTSATTQAR